MNTELRTIEGKTWGQRVAKRRNDLGLSQAQLAKLCDLRQQTISKIEAGKLTPRDKTKHLIAKNLGTHAGALFPWPVQEVA